MNDYAALAGRMCTGLEELKAVVERALLLSSKAIHSGDDGYWDGVALNLHNFYSGVERILEDVARTVDISVPEGPDWHRDLLMQMSAEVHGIRPAALQQDTRRYLDQYRGFRHVVRNVYAFNLRPARLQELSEDLSICFEAVTRDLQTFAKFLEQAEE